MDGLRSELPQILEPLEKRERKLVIEWPEKEDLLARKERFIEDHMDEMKKEIVDSGLVIEDGVELDDLARAGLGAKFMLTEMQRIVSIPLEGAIDIVDDFEYYEHKGWFSHVEEDKRHIFTIYFNSLDQLLEDRDSQIDVLALMGIVHEFAHAVYYQEASVHENKHALQGLEQSRMYHKFGRLAGWESKDESYLSLDLEIRARTWQLKFLKLYFPESKYVKLVEKELERGRQVREKRARIGREDEDWKKRERERLGFSE